MKANYLNDLKITGITINLLEHLKVIKTFELALYHKHISQNPIYQEWADEAIADYYKMLKDNPPDIDTIKYVEQIETYFKDFKDWLLNSHSSSHFRSSN